PRVAASHGGGLREVGTGAGSFMALPRLARPMPKRRSSPVAMASSVDLAWADRIIHGDAGAALDRLPRDSVHLSVTSPPYNVGIQYAGYSDDRSYEEYLRWLGGIGRSLYRTLVPGGRFALNVAPTSIKNFRPIHHDLARVLQDVGYILRTEIIWYKQTMGRRTAWGSWRSPANPHVIPSWEYVLVFSKESWRLEGDKGQIDIGSKEFQTISDGFWAIPPERNRRGHPAPFPWELIQRLVRFYTYRGNTVLDMFGGTGTVAAVARANGRHFVSIDASSEYCHLALDRVASSPPTAPGAIFPAPVRVTELSELPRKRR
ncbi:MAG: site-specific DNA-methyltransferase, partial [Thermoplasmata archaeon]|nr:site-specific DNA-methyltransferase [Thermoplasmata archaeon]